MAQTTENFQRPQPPFPESSATKCAINTFTKALAKMLIEKGIRVNVLAPGPVWTPLNPADPGEFAEKVSQFGKQHPIGRPAQPYSESPGKFSLLWLSSEYQLCYIEAMRIRQMGFSSKLKAHKKILTLETLKFISEYLVDGNARLAALRSGIPETYASRMGSWLKKQPMVVAALERELDERELKRLHKIVAEIEAKMEECKEILGIEEM